MKKISLWVLFLMLLSPVFSQQLLPEINPVTEQQLESITVHNDDAETEDDSYQQQLSVYRKHPLNINDAEESEFKSLYFISPLQIENLFGYKRRLGNLIDIYELQAVPGWDIKTIQRISPYITVSENEKTAASLKKRFKNGDQILLLRFSRVLEKSEGYKIGPDEGKNYYEGSPQKLLLRYRYSYKNILQYGLLGEKDGGEQFFKGKEKAGFDFYSAHFFAKNLGHIKALAIGDFTVNMGQGLVQWMSLAFKKSVDILSVKRASDILRPYNSAGEINFHRGAGITFSKNRLEATVFGSYRNIDANFNAGDTTRQTENFVTSFQTSGYHRTPAEIADKHIQSQIAIGGNVSYTFKNLHAGLNAIHYRFKYPLIKPGEPYNLYAFTGKSFGNYSLDYAITHGNFHLFGEVAFSERKYPAVISGMLISVSAKADMSIVYRDISKGYRSLYTNAFTENTSPENEKGLFAGITVRPSDSWEIDAYTDHFRFPWLKYRVNAPSRGNEYCLQFSYKPDKALEINNRYRVESKLENEDGDYILSPVIPVVNQNWRTGVIYKLNKIVTVKCRTEIVWVSRHIALPESGFLIFGDLLYKPVSKPYAANMRLQYFETDSYASRLYAYENDVLYSYSIPVFYDKGYRYYLNINYDFTKRCSFWIKFSRFIYPEKNTIGSGLDKIPGKHRSELKIEGLYRF